MIADLIRRREGTSMADPKVEESQLTSQGQIYQTAFKTDEKIPELETQYRGAGATTEQKEDESKPWITGGRNDVAADDGHSRHQYDHYAQELDKRLGPIAFVKDKVADTVESAMGKESATSNSTSKTSDTFSQYTQAAWEKVNDLKPTFGANQSSLTGTSAMDASSVMPNVGHKLLAAGGDDVFKVMADGGSSHNDAMKANMRVTAETLM